VISTNCGGVNLDNFEFAFDCTTPTHEVQRHSFGFGGFDEQEEFDTSVKCTICEPPTDKHHVLVGTGSTSKTTVDSKSGSSSASTSNTKSADDSKSKKSAEADKKKENDGDKKKENDGFFDKAFSGFERKVVKYGPDECVSTYRNNAGHCVMETKCEKENINDYEFGLICVDKTGEPVRHVFGKNSFDPEESFDTLIACDKCLGLDDMADDASLEKQVEGMTKEVKDMATKLEKLEENVVKLNKKAGIKKEEKKDDKKEEKKEDKKEEKKEDKKGEAEKALAHVSSSHKEKPVAEHRKHAKLHLKKKHSHHRKIQKEEDSDEDDDQDEDRDQDRDQDEDEDQEQDDQQDDSEEQ